MQLLRKLPNALEGLFGGSIDEIIFFALIFIFILYSNNREDRGIGLGDDRSNNTIILLIAAFLFIFMDTGREEDLTLINNPA